MHNINQYMHLTWNLHWAIHAGHSSELYLPSLFMDMYTRIHSQASNEPQPILPIPGLSSNVREHIEKRSYIVYINAALPSSWLGGVIGLAFWKLLKNLHSQSEFKGGILKELIATEYIV